MPEIQIKLKKDRQSSRYTTLRIQKSKGKSTFIDHSKSLYSSPIVILKKRKGKWRLCVDFREINAKSVKDTFPMPRINYIIDQLREARYISSLDLKDGYWQIPLEENSRQYTAFTVPGKGLFQWDVMPFGLHSASATFQQDVNSRIRLPG